MDQSQVDALMKHVEEEMAKTPHAQRLGDGQLLSVLVPVVLNWLKGAGYIPSLPQLPGFPPKAGN